MQSSYDSLEKTIQLWKDRCIEYENSLNSKEKEISKKLASISKKLATIKIKNENLEKEFSGLKEDYEKYSQKKLEESKRESYLIEEESRLKELIQKNNLLKEELNQFRQNCEKFNDPNFIYSLLRYWPPAALFQLMQSFNIYKFIWVQKCPTLLTNQQKKKKKALLNYFNFYVLVNKNRFEFCYVLGKGGFGKVWKVIDKKYTTAYALKELSKVRILDKKSDKSVIYERELLAYLKHPFLVNMHYAFQDSDSLYLVIDLLTGGDLRYHIFRQKRFSEDTSRFFISCIILGLEYIHSNNVLHRDIKPENLVLDNRGYLRITDFGVAKLYSPDNASETSGTPGYMAPEVMRSQNHTLAVDFFALGVIAHEFMLGVRPYLGKSRKEIKDQIMAKQATVQPGEIPYGWSDDAADFINKLLIRKPDQRLGYRGSEEVKAHPWLKNYPWKELREKALESPYIPENKDNFDKKYCEGVEKIGNDTNERYEQYKLDENYQSLFLNYTYITTMEDSHWRKVTKNEQRPSKSKTSNLKKSQPQQAWGLIQQQNAKKITKLKPFEQSIQGYFKKDTNTMMPSRVLIYKNNIRQVNNSKTILKPLGLYNNNRKIDHKTTLTHRATSKSQSIIRQPSSSFQDSTCSPSLTPGKEILLSKVQTIHVVHSPLNNQDSVDIIPTSLPQIISSSAKKKVIVPSSVEMLLKNYKNSLNSFINAGYSGTSTSPLKMIK